jgi:hypothetical protein
MSYTFFFHNLEPTVYFAQEPPIFGDGPHVSACHLVEGSGLVRHACSRFDEKYRARLDCSPRLPYQNIGVDCW